MSAPSPAPIPTGRTLPVPAACSGCGAVLAPAPTGASGPADAAAACQHLFAETTRALREEAVADSRAAATVALADVAYAAQHPGITDPDRLAEALTTLAARLGDEPNPDPAPRPPAAWQMTSADIAADLDVVGIEALIESWARAVAEDWSRATRT